MMFAATILQNLVVFTQTYAHHIAQGCSPLWSEVCVVTKFMLARPTHMLIAKNGYLMEVCVKYSR